MSRIRSKDTNPETIVRLIVYGLGYRYRLNVRALPGTPDIVLTRLMKVIDVRGCFWHVHDCKRSHMPKSKQPYWEPKLKRNVQRDRQSNRQLRRLGWDVLVVWECETRDLFRLSKRLTEFLSK